MDTRTTLALSRSLALAVLALLLLISFPGEARACSCAPVTTADVVASAEYVFVGEEIGRSTARTAWPPVAVTFRVVEAYKGTIESEITVWTGSGEADCGLTPTRGLVGITAYSDGLGAISVDSCGSLHDPGAIAALLDPIEVFEASPEPTEPDGGMSAVPWVLAGLGGIAAAATLIVVRVRRRNDDWQDGWSGGA